MRCCSNASPWNHSGSCARPRRYLAGLDFGESCVLDLRDLHLQWYDWTLKGKAKPGFLKNRVVYFVEDANCWHSADCLHGIETERARYYLTSHHGKPTLTSPGKLSVEMPSTLETADFVYDPLDTSPGEFERTTETVYHHDLSHVERFLVDQNSVLTHTLKENGLVYESEPVQSDIEITGYLRFVVWISMDVPDTDFQVCIYELTSDGHCIILTDDMMRARYRNSLTTESLVTRGEINRYEFNQFQLFFRRIRKGSRLRLVFQCVNSIYWQKNYNGGGAVTQETAKDAQTAHVTVHQDPDHISFLEIPITKQQRIQPSAFAREDGER
jgi:putative CocE/NonD family hydrolase